MNGLIGAHDGMSTLAASAVSPAAARRAALARAARRATKRTIDIVVAAAILLISVPVFLMVAIAVVAESPGPVFYRADRVGRGGRRMRMFKFRKMAPDAGGPRLTTGNDPRLTRVGALLTRSKLDELPQLINVLRGEMSLVGPRPEDPCFVARRPRDYEEILAVRPGITGPSQIAFAEESRILTCDDPVARYLERIFPQKIAIDCAYAERLSIRRDLRILFWTAVTVVLRRPVAVDRETGSMGLRRRTAPAPWIEPQPQPQPQAPPTAAGAAGAGAGGDRPVIA
jgi:lipopolysaccharide/colanic/teichoic acid biosynthesis glycosyltransferase